VDKPVSWEWGIAQPRREGGVLPEKLAEGMQGMPTSQNLSPI